MTKEVLNTFVLVAIEPKKPLKRPAQSKTKQEVGCKCHARIMPVDSARATRATRGKLDVSHSKLALTRAPSSTGQKKLSSGSTDQGARRKGFSTCPEICGRRYYERASLAFARGDWSQSNARQQTGDEKWNQVPRVRAHAQGERRRRKERRERRMRSGNCSSRDRYCNACCEQVEAAC